MNTHRPVTPTPSTPPSTPPTTPPNQRIGLSKCPDAPIKTHRIVPLNLDVSSIKKK